MGKGGWGFRVEIDGIPEIPILGVRGLGSEVEVRDQRDAANPQFIQRSPGAVRYHNIVLAYAATEGRALFEWHQGVLGGDADPRNGAVVLLDPEGAEAARWDFFNGWPVKYEGPELSAAATEVPIQSLEIVHEGLELT
ncbi:MAG: phage tail protein [Acidimicrobiales bacterium]